MSQLVCFHKYYVINFYVSKKKSPLKTFNIPEFELTSWGSSDTRPPLNEKHIPQFTAPKKKQHGERKPANLFS